MKIIQMHNSTESQMMGYLLVTEQGRMIAVDGGTEGDTRAFVELVQHFGGYIDLWILTHPHSDHVGVFWSLMDTPAPIAVDCVCYSPAPAGFDTVEDTDRKGDIKRFQEAVGHCGYPVRILTPGDLFIQDQVEIEILRVADARCRKDYINNLSVVFKVTEKFKENAKRRIPGETEKQSPFTMIFLGDLGWTQGDRLLECCSDRPGILRADAVQMAHHGQWGVEENVYQAIGPRWSFWPTPDWLWTNTPKGAEHGSGPWRTLETRGWMERLGACPVTSLESHTIFDTGDETVRKLVL